MNLHLRDPRPASIKNGGRALVFAILDFMEP